VSEKKNLKVLAENYRNINGDVWYAEESKELDSIPCFSAEAFIAAASPAAVLELIAEAETGKPSSVFIDWKWIDLPPSLKEHHSFDVLQDELSKVGVKVMS
jgi:hypothetical protein